MRAGCVGVWRWRLLRATSRASVRAVSMASWMSRRLLPARGVPFGIDVRWQLELDVDAPTRRLGFRGRTLALWVRQVVLVPWVPNRVAARRWRLRALVEGIFWMRTPFSSMEMFTPSLSLREDFSLLLFFGLRGGRGRFLDVPVADDLGVGPAKGRDVVQDGHWTISASDNRIKRFQVMLTSQPA